VLLDTKLSEILRHSPKELPVRKMKTTWNTHAQIERNEELKKSRNARRNE